MQRFHLISFFNCVYSGLAVCQQEFTAGPGLLSQYCHVTKNTVYRDSHFWVGSEGGEEEKGEKGITWFLVVLGDINGA